MSVNELERYIESLINANKQEASTYSNNVKVSIKGNKLRVIFNSPTAFKLDNELYFKIFDILNVPLFPILTLVPKEKMEVEEVEDSHYTSARCFVYPFRVGVPKRKVFSNFSSFENSIKNGSWEIMQGLNINLNGLTSIAIASSSGGGKSYLINQFLKYFKKIGCKMIIVDGKKDLPAKFAIKHGIKLITNEANKSDDNILSDVCDELKEDELIPIVLVFDEIGALTNLASKNVKDNFFKLLTRVATLGRQAKVHLLLSSQRFDANTIPTIVKEQCNILIQLGTLTTNQLQYLFPDYKQLMLLIPADEIGDKGKGIISINNDLFTFLVPTIKELD